LKLPRPLQTEQSGTCPACQRTRWRRRRSRYRWRCAGSETWILTQADWKRLDSFRIRCQRRILHTRWYDFVSNNEVLRRSGLLAASAIVHKRRLGLFGHVARLTEDVPANQILRTCYEAQDGTRPSPDWKRARGRSPITWIHQICRDTGISVTDALQLAEGRSFWRQIATAECYGWMLRVVMMMMMYLS